MMDFDAQQAREHARQSVVEKAVAAADRHLLDSSDGSSEMTNRLTAEVARRLLHRAIQPLRVDPLSMCISGIAYASAIKAEQVLSTECPEDSPAVRDWLLFQVALKFVEKVGCTFNADLLR